MGKTRFDSWARMLGAHGSRRTTLRTVTVGALAAVLLTRGREEAAAKCVNPGKKCKSKHGGKKKCCGGAKCQGSKCKCSEGLIPCGGLCLDAQEDVEHCGQCGNACGGAEICHFGNCCVESGPPGPHNACCSGIICNPPGQNCVCG